MLESGQLDQESRWPAYNERMVVPVRSEAEWTIYKAIEEVVELNRDHKYSFTRDELVAMLDDELETGDGFERAVQRPRQ